MTTTNPTIAADALPDIGFDEQALAIWGEHGENAHTTSFGTIATTAVTRAIGFVDGSGIVERMNHLYDTYRVGLRGNRARAGRPPEMDFRQLMILLFISVLDGRPPLTVSLEGVLKRICETDLHRMGLTIDDAIRPGLYDRINRTIHRFVDCVDPFPSDRGKRPTWEEHTDLLERERAEPESVQTMVNRLDWFAEGLLEATWLTLPAVVRARWTGNLAVDGTHLAGPKNGNKPTLEYVSIDRDTGYWSRGGDHSVDDYNVQEQHVNGYEATLAITAPNLPHNAKEPAEFPLLALGMTLHKPAHTTTIAGAKVTASIHRRGHPAGIWLGDGLLFPLAAADNLQKPVRAMGYQFASDLPDSALGRNDSHRGANLVEGTWYCPAMPTYLEDATTSYRAALKAASRITDPEKRQKARRDAYDRWLEDQEERAEYAMKLRETTIQSGHKIPYACPAGITLNCPVKNRKLEEHDEKRAKVTGVPAKPRPKPRRADGSPLTLIPTKFLPKRDLEVCCNIKSTAFDPEAGIKYQQAYPYGSELQRKAYDLRATIEGFNGYAKRSTVVGLEEADKRLIRGYAGQYFLIAVLLAGANLQKAQGFLTKYGDRPTPKGPTPKPGQRDRRLAWPKKPVVATCVGAYQHLLPAVPNIDVTPDMLNRHRELATTRYKRPKSRARLTLVEPLPDDA